MRKDQQKLKGLKIHQTRMRCLEPGETEEEQGPESLHTAQRFQVVPTVSMNSYSKKKWIRGPQASRRAEWQKFVSGVQEVTAKGDVEPRLQTITTIIVNMAAEKFGVKE